MDEDAKAQGLEEQAVDTPGTPVGSLPGEHPDVAESAAIAGAREAPGGCCMSRSPAAGARSSPGAFPSRRRCCPAAVSSRAWSGASPRPSATGSGCSPRGSGVPSPDRDPRRPRRRSWLVFFISAAVLVVVSFGLGQYWQYEIRKLMGVTEYNIALVVASPVRRGAGVLPAPADRARPARPVPLGRAACSAAGSGGARRARSAGSWWPA